MELEFYPYDFEYKVEDQRVFMYLYSNLEDGSKICVKHEHYPAFFALLEGIDKDSFLEKITGFEIATPKGIAKITKHEIVTKELLGKEKQFDKITANFPKAVTTLAKVMQEWGVECFERDILFVHRYLRDTQIIPMQKVVATVTKIENSQFRIPLYEATSIKPIKSSPKSSWKILALDIETYAISREIDSTKNPILMVGLYGEDEKGKRYQHVITWKEFEHDLDYLEIVKDEKELLTRLRDIIVKQNPDIITGYFSDGFDFPYISERAKKHKIKFNIGVDSSELRVFSGSGFRSSEAKIPGILHIDMLKFVKYIFGMNLKTDSYSLNAVAAELLGSTKHEVNLSQLSNIWDNVPSELPQFCAYNLQDSHLTYKLCSLLLFDMIEFTQIVGLPTYDVIRMRFSRLVENYIMRRALEFNVIAPNKPTGGVLERRRSEHVQGAFVYEPKPGMYKDVVVVDFRSLYPTVIVSHNIGPESFKQGEDAKDVPGLEGYWFSEEKAFMPSVLEEIINKRALLKKEIKKLASEKKDVTYLEARSYALKILANSFYGYLGFFGARWYSLESAAATTAYARHYIKTTIDAAKKEGFDVIYGDTDSCFFTLGTKTRTDATRFISTINKTLPGVMELELEGYFSRGLFVEAKGSKTGAKKKYALLKEDDSLKIVGFEFVRRNWSQLAKDAQEHVLTLILHEKNEEAIEYVKKILEKLKSGTFPIEKLIIKTQITREISQYSSQGPHVHVAKQLIDKGEKVPPGTIISYVVAKGEGLVRERAKIPTDVQQGEYDIEYYITHQLIPAVSSIFSVIDVSADELLGKGKQTGLGGFM